MKLEFNTSSTITLGYSNCAQGIPMPQFDFDDIIINEIAMPAIKEIALPVIKLFVLNSAVHCAERVVPLISQRITNIINEILLDAMKDGGF